MRNAPSAVAAAAFAACILAACSGKNDTASNAPAPAAPVKPSNIALTRTITIPARVAADPATAPPDSGVLTLSEGGDDELPEGPTSFDLTADGGFVVADPLRQRIVFYDSTGKFRSDMLIHFGAERLRVLPNNVLSIVRYQGGDRLIFEPNPAGQYGAPRAATERDPDPDAIDAGSVQLQSGEQAIVAAQPAPGAESAPLSVRFQAVGESMVSVRRLGADARQRTFVAIEAAFAGQRVDVRKIVRKYAPGSQNLVEILDIPLNYYVHPVDEFRIRDGLVYQLMPQATEVRINVWDTNSRP